MALTYLLQVAESSGCLASAVIFLVHPPTQWLVEQMLESCVIWVTSAGRARDMGHKTTQVVAPLLSVGKWRILRHLGFF